MAVPAAQGPKARTLASQGSGITARHGDRGQLRFQAVRISEDGTTNQLTASATAWTGRAVEANVRIRMESPSEVAISLAYSVFIWFYLR